ncbi:hypothetical protein PG984_009969 [Apiospora sp. TS-2023a]
MPFEQASAKESKVTEDRQKDDLRSHSLQGDMRASSEDQIADDSSELEANVVRLSEAAGSTPQQAENQIFDVVCSMFCYLNMVPIILEGIQMVQNGGEVEEPLATTSEYLQGMSEVDRLEESRQKLEEELRLQKNLIKGLKASLQSANNLRQMQEDDLHHAESLEEKQHSLISHLKPIKLRALRAEASNFAFIHDLSEMTGRALAAEDELGELQSELANLEDANRDLYNDLTEARDSLNKAEVEKWELRNAVIVLLVDNRRLQATQAGVFRRIRDTRD